MYNQWRRFWGREMRGKLWGKSVISPPQCFSLSVVTYTLQRISVSCTKFQISCPDLAGRAYSAPPNPLAGGEGARCPLPKNPTPLSGLGLLKYFLFNIASVAAEKCPLSFQTPQSVHRPHYCGVQTLPLKMHYMSKNCGKIGEGIVGF